MLPKSAYWNLTTSPMPELWLLRICPKCHGSVLPYQQVYHPEQCQHDGPDPQEMKDGTGHCKGNTKDDPRDRKEDCQDD